ncbi:WXG100 family type VII secretion target [Actinoallomurus soli]|uniref:WXG100 family type VII secretion target n=1 Tax=Actinoallomurus soli TaxID=2952535 RepID=UPI002091FF5A|nr:WXG100 family type VII secretion target [Actinoallomurus soli]MCO5966918.1 WXG100 family type VII secretion target [Actinoallomurus soli]
MALDHRTFAIKSGGRPQGAGSYGDADTVRRMIAATQPAKITTAAAAYDAMGTALNELQTALYDAAKVLAGCWGGPAADNAQQVLRCLYTTAEELVIRSNETAKTLQWYGGSILPMYRSIQWPENTRSPAATTAADQIMKNLNERIAQTWDGMPPQIERTLPRFAGRGDGSPDADADADGADRLGTSGAKRQAGHVRIGVPRMPEHPSRTSRGGPTSRSHGLAEKPIGDSSGLPSGLGTGLAGMAPSEPGSLKGGLGLGGGPPLGDVPAGPGGADLGGPMVQAFSGTIGPGGSLFGSGAGSSLFNEESSPSPGRETGTRQRLGAGESRAGARGSGEAGPMISGGRRPDEKERQRTVWLVEDQDVWTGEAEVAPSVIGDASDHLGRRKQDDDEFLTVDELQDLLDLVDEPAKETGEGSNQPPSQSVTGTKPLSAGGDYLIDLGDDIFGPDHFDSNLRRD